jgi:hypothetical protein
MKSKKNKAPEIDDSLNEPGNVKERVTTLIDFDVLKWLRGEADKIGVGYQTLLNMKLRELMNAPSEREQLEDAIRSVLRDEEIIARTDKYTVARVQHSGAQKRRHGRR